MPISSVRFIKQGTETLLRYEPTPMDENILAKLCIDFDGAGNVIRYTPDTLPSELKLRRPALQTDARLTIKKVFTFAQDDLVNGDCNEDVLVFRFAELDKRRPTYLRVPGRIFSIEQDVLLAEDVRLVAELFCVGYDRRTSAVAKIAKILDASESQIIIGGDDEDAIPFETYRELLENFPTTTNLEHYGEALIESCVQDYLTPKKDYGAQYRHAQTRSSRPREDFQLGSPALNRDRAVTLHAARDQLFEMLAKGDTVRERDWQQGILDVLPVLFPQYVAVIPNAKIKDVIAKETRYADFLLVDASGNVDVLEIKRAFGKGSLMMKRTYRKNFIPARELTGGIAQIEKYIHLLLNWGKDGEERLTEKARSQGRIPDDLSIRFLNPRGLLLIGGCKLDEDEQRDFDLIRRQYAHVADVITYNDLLQRLERMLAAVDAEPTNAR